MRLYILEAFCSIPVAGLGQIIKGEGKKGVCILLYIYFVLPAAAYLSLLINGYIFLYVLGFSLLSGIIVWIYAVMDALLNQKAGK